MLPRRLIVIGAARIITVAVGAVINVVVVAFDGVGIIGVNDIIIVNKIIIGAAALERTEDATDHLNVPDHRQDVALRPDVAAGGALKLAA